MDHVCAQSHYYYYYYYRGRYTLDVNYLMVLTMYLCRVGNLSVSSSPDPDGIAAKRKRKSNINLDFLSDMSQYQPPVSNILPSVKGKLAFILNTKYILSFKQCFFGSA